MNRKPAGYIGTNHETIGSDILAVMKVVQMPEQILGPELTAKLKVVRPDTWYPVSLLLEALEAMDAKLGTIGLRNVGWELFRRSHAEAVKVAAKSASDIIHGFDGMYRRANRGLAIGGWKVVAFAPGQATLEKTTPHHCVMEEGIFQEALQTIGIPAEVTQSKCFRKGADLCVFEVSSFIKDHRWTGR